MNTREMGKIQIQQTAYWHIKPIPAKNANSTHLVSLCLDFSTSTSTSTSNLLKTFQQFPPRTDCTHPSLLQIRFTQLCKCHDPALHICQILRILVQSQTS